METVRVELNGRYMRITLRCASFETAMRVAYRNYLYPPDGYRLNRCAITRRNHSGRRMVLALGFLHADRRVEQMTLPEALDLFEIDAEVAAGNAEYPKEGGDAPMV